ncbi:recombinase family protein [Alicyclobacillus fastidiosus]|uniref:Recombinase family protein n=1 Tax=Alicyclobacillus fastidiosus TaxID=392011 RepID=A0ABY6ZK98_9BACL|nr:recombinase family protein [Alicyclobacillus fastidiosus]WAH43322.1 recombinase family protein [Alicyclobacillus fastidiosus]GMA65377.1 integrase [Alicyclobacillus fastidiosus]
MRTAIYTRVSTDVQAEEGFSLDAQLHRLHSYCESQGWSIVGIYTDEGFSAKNVHRPQLERMLNDAQAGKIDVVLVYRLDRLTRNVTDLHQLLEIFDRHGVGFKSATEVFDTTTAMGRLFITIVAALAQWERENLGERVRFGQAEMVRQGRYFGHTPPYGYDLKDGVLSINPVQAPVIRLIFDRYLAGDGTSRLAKYLNDSKNNIPRPRGSDQWSMKVINAILKNPVYCGYVRYGNQPRNKAANYQPIVAKSDHERIVQEYEWRRAQALMEQRRTGGPRTGTGVHPLVGILRCGKCGGPMVGRTEQAGKSGRVTPYHGYMCNTRRHARTCDMKMWKRDVIEGALIDELDRTVHAALENNFYPPQVEQKDHAQIESQLTLMKARRRKWMDAYERDLISAEDLRDRLNDLSRTEDQLKSRLHAHAAQTSPIRLDEFISIKTAWNVATPLERRELIRTMVETAWVFPDGSVKVDLRSDL